MKQLICAYIILFSATGFAFDHSHKNWDAFLKKTVHLEETKSSVDYEKAVKLKPDLMAYNQSLSAVKKTDFDEWTKQQQLSFLVNAYNSFTIQQIVTHYPVDSIKDNKISWLSPFNQKFFHLFGEKISTSHLEHKMIRKWYDEPRIHFAIVCASIGCPALQDSAFNVDNMDKLFDRGAVIFLNDKSRNRYNAKTKSLEISLIFKWFKEDFEKGTNTVPKFISKFMKLSPADAVHLDSGKAKVEYLDYDWKLNKK